MAEAREPAGPRRERGRDAKLRVREAQSCCNRSKTKFRKAHKGRIHGVAKGGTTLDFRRISG